MSFKANDDRLLNKYTKIQERVSSLMNIKFDNEAVYDDNDKYIEAKLKSYRDKVNTDFQGNKIPKESASCKCLSLIMLDSVVRANKRYYYQTLLKEWKYKITRNKVENPIHDDLDSSASDESDGGFDNGSDN